MDIEFVIYRSVAVRRVTEPAMIKIMNTSWKNNRRFGLTGFLHFDGKYFLQYLEGPPTPLFDRLAVIARDRRHGEVKILAEGDIDKRFFPDWDMGFLTNHDILPASILNRDDWYSEPSESDVMELINAFAEQAAAGMGYEISLY